MVHHIIWDFNKKLYNFIKYTKDTPRNFINFLLKKLSIYSKMLRLISERVAEVCGYLVDLRRVAKVEICVPGW